MHISDDMTLAGASVHNRPRTVAIQLPTSEKMMGKTWPRYPSTVRYPKELEARRNIGAPT